MNHLIPLLEDARRCDYCKHALPHEPRPVIQAAEGARIMIIGQAPGAKVHASGIPWDDLSGQRLRKWMGVNKQTFYDASEIAIVPMGFCYPGKGHSGDLPPRPECAPKWHDRILNALPNIKLTLLVGAYAQKYYLKKQYSSLTETVTNWQALLPTYFPLPHPSPRNQFWLKKHPWFEEEAVITLQKQISHILRS